MQEGENSLVLVQKQIQELKAHPHVEQIVAIKPLTYKVVYWPQNLDSLYSQMRYDLKLTLPENYPEKAPFLTFIDKIYHLNINPSSGQVSMSILKDDWSPFLNLNAIFCSLDEVLQNPDQQNAATTNLLYEYQDDINKYVQKVREFLGMNSRNNPNQNKSDDEQQMVEQVIDVKDLDFENLGKQGFQNDRKNNSNKNQQNQNNMDPKTFNKELKNHILSQSQQLPTSPRRKDSSRQKPYSNVNQGANKQQTPLIAGKINVNELSSIVNYQEVIKQSRESINQNKNHQTFDGLKLNMIRCKELIKIFSQELQELEQQSQRNKAIRLKQILEDRCQRLMQMIVELFDISQKINLKLMDTVRKDFKKYS